MKNFLVALALVPTLVWSMVFESDKMEVILPHIEEETWVLIDVDNTLVESSLHLGSAQWRRHIRTKAKSAGCDAHTTEEVLDKFWVFVQHFIPVRSVDPHAAELIEKLKASQIVTLALTAREPIEMQHTPRQLASVGVSLVNPGFPDLALLQSETDISLFADGVIYCGNNSKSDALIAFMQEVGKTPKKVIFIDDNLDQVKDVEKMSEQMGIAFVGVRFSKADERVKAFDPEIADLQFSYLPQIICDERAQEILNALRVDQSTHLIHQLGGADLSGCDLAH